MRAMHELSRHHKLLCFGIHRDMVGTQRTELCNHTRQVHSLSRRQNKGLKQVSGRRVQFGSFQLLTSPPQADKALAMKELYDISRIENANSEFIVLGD